MTHAVDPSPAARAPHADTLMHCTHARRCGGCPLIALDYPSQLAHKHARVVHALSAYRTLDGAEATPILGAEPNRHYRTRAKLMVSSDGRIGLYAHGGGHHVVDIPGCQVLAPVLHEVIAALRERVQAGPQRVPALSPARADFPGLRAIDVREVRGAGDPPRALLTLVLDREAGARLGDELRHAAEQLQQDLPQLLGVAVNWHDGLSPQVLGAQTQLLAGAATVRDRIGAVEHRASYGSFVQAHRGQAARIHELLSEWLLPQPAELPARPARVLDAYGGSGAIALALASRGAEVHVVESFAPAVESLLQHARSAGLALSAEAGDAAATLQRLAKDGERFDAAVANPPRRGLSPDARTALAQLGAPRLAYVSCDPTTLARDLSHLRRLGYAPRKVQPLDMIPHTEEVETAVLLERVEKLSPRVLYEDDELLVLDRPAHEPEPRTDAATELRPLLAHAADVSGAFAYAKGERAHRAWRARFEGEGARAVYLAYVRGVTVPKGTVAKPLRDGNQMHSARTRFRRLAVCAGHSVLRVVPEGAAPLQVRRHLALLGHPVLGDRRFGHAPSNRFFEERYALDRAFQHCVRLELNHPVHGELRIESPLPGDLRATLERAGGPDLVPMLVEKAALGRR